MLYQQPSVAIFVDNVLLKHPWGFAGLGKKKGAVGTPELPLRVPPSGQPRGIPRGQGNNYLKHPWRGQMQR